METAHFTQQSQLQLIAQSLFPLLPFKTKASKRLWCIQMLWEKLQQAEKTQGNGIKTEKGLICLQTRPQEMFHRIRLI